MGSFFDKLEGHPIGVPFVCCIGKLQFGGMFYTRYCRGDSSALSIRKQLCCNGC